jgi:hypothetical protein
MCWAGRNTVIHYLPLLGTTKYNLALNGLREAIASDDIEGGKKLLIRVTV